MTDTVERQFVTKFDTDLRLLSQQKVSRLRNTVFNRGAIEGVSFTINNLDKVEMKEKTQRLSATVLEEIDHTARLAVMRDFFLALPMDRADVPKMKVNPVTGGHYMQTLLAARNRKVDDVIFSAVLGPIGRADGAPGSYVLPPSQIIAAGGTGLSKAKVIQARAMFRANETDEEEEIYFLWDSLAMQQILADPELTSNEYLAGQMLQQGNVAGKWMGFTWIPYERTQVVGAVHTTAAYAKSAVHFGQGHEEGDVSKRPDIENATQVSMAGSYGAGRQDEKKVVSVSYQ